MNRYVAVPVSMMTEGQVPPDAIKIARMYSLELKAVDDCKEVSIVSTPVIKKVDYDKDYSNDRVWSLDLTDEFIDMGSDCYIVVQDQIYRPKIREKHCLKFRIRLHGEEEKKVLVFVNGLQVEEIAVAVRQ